MNDLNVTCYMLHVTFFLIELTDLIDYLDIIKRINDTSAANADMKAQILAHLAEVEDSLALFTMLSSLLSLFFSKYKSIIFFS